MSTPRVRWSLRLPWSSTVRLRRLVHRDGPGRPGDICGRAIVHLLDQPEGVVLALLAGIGTQRAAQPTDRTQVVSLRADAGLVTRVRAWLDAHPQCSESLLVDTAIRTYLLIVESDTNNESAVSGLAPRRYRRLSELVVVLDGQHAA